MNDNNPSDADSFGQVADESLEAFRQGQRLSSDEFARRYPEHADDIREMLPALVLMEQAKSAEDTPGQRRQADAAPLRQPGDCQTLREVGRGGRGRESSDRQCNEQLCAPGRDTELSLCSGVRGGAHTHWSFARAWLADTLAGA
jgi:hypothetical protein